MKVNKSWQFWTALAIVAAILIAALICHLIQPKVTYAWLEFVSVITFILGFISHYLLVKNKPTE